MSDPSRGQGESLENEADVVLPAAGEGWDPCASTLDEDDPGGTQPDDIRAFSSPLTFERRYEVLGVLSRSRLGQIRLCKDRPFAREVAMKVLRLASCNPSNRWRFFREARVQGQLGHPAIVPVYDLGVDPRGDLFFTMKWVRGLRLDEALRELRDGSSAPTFSRRRLLQRVSQMCLAIHYAHSRGVVHRDLKPANIMLGQFGEIFVLDWGLAKVLSEAHPRYDPIDDASGAIRTSNGSVLGTVGFMAPEQLQGHVDLVDRQAVFDVVEGCEVVFHVAARFGFGSDRDAFWAVNVTGTENVIAACVAHGVGRLVTDRWALPAAFGSGY